MIAHYPKKIKVTESLQLKLSFIKMFLWTSRMQFPQPSRKRISESARKIKFWPFSIKIKMFLWTRRRKFCLPRWKIFDRRPNIFCSLSEMIWKNVCQKQSIFRHFFSYGNVKCSFNITAGRVSANLKIFWLKSEKYGKKFQKIPRKICFIHQSDPSET